jgi:hypothetical protein
MVCGGKPVLGVRHLAARIAEKRKTQVQKRDEHEKRQENKQRAWLMP